MAAHQTVTRRKLRRRRTQPQGSSPLKFVALGILLLVPLSVILAATVAFGAFQHYSEGYEPIEEVLVERPAGITRVYDRTGKVELGVLNNPSAPLAEPVELEDIAEYLIIATVSTEDNAFWDHQGVNVRGVLRAARENYTGGGIGNGSGGSSITQQLVKNVYICPSYADAEDPCVAERTIDRKLREMAYAVRLERDHSKEDILNWYLNQISYGGRYIGVQAAATGYFRKPASDLTLAESALLAGIPASPWTYHPRLNCVANDAGNCVAGEDGRVTVGGAAKARQEYVIDLMAHRGHITLLEAEAAKAEEIKIYPTTANSEQAAPAFIDSQVEPRLVRMCEAGELPKMQGAEDCASSVASGGWTVITTLDWEKNEQARQMMNDFVERGKERGCDCHNAAVVTIEPDTGQITVYVPNLNERNTEDPRVGGHIDQLVEINQPGSSLKPAVYLAWFDYLEKTPSSTLWDTSPLPLDPEEDVVDEGIEIVNPRPGGGGEGLITARSALGGSQNVPAFRAAAEVGMANFIEMAKRLGISTLHQNFDPTFLSHSSVAYGPTIATGGANIRTIDMAYMNVTLANMGEMVGLPHHGRYIEDMSELQSMLGGDATTARIAEDQMLAFQRGHLRLPDSRPLDPIAILEVRDSSGRVIYEAPEPERIQVVDAGSAWLLHTILEDCEARWIIWQCGTSNEDTRLDVFVDGDRLPAGVKTGTQQGPLAISDILASWVVGYSRHAATAVWVGNANKSLIQDGPAVGFASSHTTLHIYKNWMAEYHRALREEGRIDAFLSFEELQPPNVHRAMFPSPTTERGYGGGCWQRLNTWQRTDIEYDYDCQDGMVYLPDYKKDEAETLARTRGIPTSETRWTPPPRAQAPRPQPTPAPSEPGDGDEPADPTPAPVTPEPSEPTPEPEPPEPEPTPVADNGDDSAPEGASQSEEETDSS